MGYEVIHLEALTGRQKILRLYIDRLARESGDRLENGATIGVEDCVKVTKALDEPLDAMPEVEAIFRGAYELEVSSPGIDRPLRQSRDYERFRGREARIHVYRPLSAEELGNADYQSRNPKQKNFVGTLEGVAKDKVRIALQSAKAKAEVVEIPLALISKANLEPNFEILKESNS